MTGDENVEISIAIHVSGAQVVAALVVADDVFRESALAIILIPRRHPVGFFSASDGVDMSVTVDVCHCETMRKLDVGIDFDLLEIWAAKPKDALAVTASGEVIGVSVTIEVGGDNVCGSFFVLREYVLLPDAIRILWLFPPRKPLPVGEAVRALCCTGDVGLSVTIDIAEAHVMRSTGRVFVSENVAHPLLGSMRIGGRLKPGDRVGELRCFLVAARVSDEIEPAVAIDVASDQAVRAGNFVVDCAIGPRLAGEWFGRTLEPEHSIVRAHKVQIAVAVYIHQATMYARGARLIA